MDEKIKRPDVNPKKVAYYLNQLAAEGSNFHGEIIIKFHGGKIISVKSTESLDLHMFKQED